MQAPLVFQGISKRFGAAVALDELSLELRAGEILGFLGPNGAGKTTAIHIALGFLRASSGAGSLLGRSFGDARARLRVGFTPDAPVFFAGNAVAAIAFAARLNGLRPERSKIESTLRLVGIGEWKRDVRKFSRGMLQRLGLAQALIHDPEVLILDEPASALDPTGVIEIREILLKLRDEGKSIFFSSHQLTEVEQICDRVAFLREGKLIRYGALRELLGSAGLVEVTVAELPSDSGVRERLRRFERGEPAQGQTSNQTRWVLPQAEARAAIEAAWSAGAELMSVRPAQQSLPELFQAWTGGDGARGQTGEISQ